ncbi:hypothetical protein AgCh_008853 [Apium graveolens]
MAGKSTVLSDDEDEMEVYDNEEEADVDDDDEDEAGQDEYENDGFIVDDEEQEEGGDSDEEREKKKKRKKKESQKNYVLDEDDYELLEDNNITGFRRPEESKKFKRLKKAQRDHHSGRGVRTAEEMLQHSLFGDGAQLEDIEEDEQLEVDDQEIGDEDDMSGFIVEEDLDEHGSPVRRKVTNKKPRPGVSSAALQEAHEIFGNVDDLLKRRKQGLTEMSGFDDPPGRRKELRNIGGFDPTILSEKYMTEKDDIIRNIDFPERLQIFEHTTGPPPTTESSIDEESIWICNQLRNMIHLYGRIVGTSELPIVKEDVMRFLDFIHIQKLDVSFIAMYRKDECPSLFKDPEQLETDGIQNSCDKKPALTWHKVLWTIVDLDKKWLLLQKRKSALQSYYKKRYAEESRIIDDETRLILNRQLFDSVTKSLREAESEREVDDVDLKFNIHFPPGEVGDIDGQYKRPKRKSQYNCCSKAGLWGLASKFGYSPEQFGLQLSLEKMRMEELLDSKETPEEAASNFICAMFGTPQNVLRGARHMAAVEICCEPYVRKHVRSIYMDNAVVSTSPTADGNVAINTSHQYARIKWLREKPLAKFTDAQWLLIQKAEEQKLIKVTIKLPESVLTKMISDSNENYLSDGVSKSAQLWNEQRKLILQDSFFDLLLPSMEKEARLLLVGRARSWLLLEYGKLLWDRVCVAPYQRKEQNPSSDEETAPRVMACCWGPGKPATTFVMLDSSGEVLDVLYAGSICNRGQSVNDQQRKKNDQQRVLKFMTEHQPHVVVLGAANFSCTRLKEDIYEIIFKMVEHTPRDVGQEMDGISVLYGDEALPHLYEDSRISSDQLPLQPGIVKRAVALGRYLQNPLAMVATLCGPGKEILSWKLSPLDEFLISDEKFGMIEQIMVDVTNQVGLDINLALTHEWLFSTMQFISGLGPRKAVSLMRSLVRSGAIFTRKDLLTEHGIGKRVFINSVGFLRVRRNGMAASSNQFIDLLDDTRIHPESYGLAQELAKDVYLEDIQDETIDDDDEVLQMAIEHVREKPHLLKSLEVHEYAKSKRSENKIQTLNLIRLELIHGFQDWRKPYAEPSQDEEFCMISGETEDSLAEGRTVQATIRRVLPQKAICVLDSGMVGLLAKEDYADDWKELPDLTEKLNEGDIITCKIKSILKNRYQIFLSCKESEMRNNQYENHQSLDPYYHEDRSSLPVDQDKVRKQEFGRKHFKPRMIVHPRFQNVTADEAVQFLADKDIGESVVRPSSRGPSFLTLTLKVYKGIYAHKDILEGGKEHKDIASLLRIGKTLKIGDDTFEDLDEVIDRYVDPLVVQLKVMLNYRKFKRGTKAEVDELLRIEKAENPMRIVYCFGISHEHPGTCILTYIRSSNPHHEYVGVYPTGFKFRRKMFGDIDRLVAYFQRHIDDPQKSAQSIRSVAAMVPMGSAATEGQSGGWNDSSNSGDGWGGQSSDQDQTFTPGSRAGRGDLRNGGSQDGHPSGIPRPNGGRGSGRGRGRGSYDGSGRGNGRSSNKKDLDSGIQSYGGGDTGGWGGNGGGDDATTGSGGSSGGWGGTSGNDSGGGSGGGWGGSGGDTAGGWGVSGGDARGGGSGGDTAGGWGGSGGSGVSGGATAGAWGGTGGSGGTGGVTDGAWGGTGSSGGSGGATGSWGGSGGDTAGGWGGSGGSGGATGSWGGSGGATGAWGGNGDGSGGTSGGWGKSGGDTGGTAGSWGGSGGDTGSGASGGTTSGWGASGGGGRDSGGWGGGGAGSGGTTSGWGASGADNGGYGGNSGGGFGGMDSGGSGRGRGRDGRGRGRGRDGRGRGWGADDESGGSSWGGRRGGGGYRGRGGGGRSWGGTGGSHDVESGGTMGNESGGSGWGSVSNSSWGATGTGGGGDKGGGGSGGWGADKDKGSGGGSGSNSIWGATDEGKGGGGGSGWGSGSNSSLGATGTGGGGDKGVGGRGGWGADKGKGSGGGSGSNSIWGATDEGKGGGGGSGWGSGSNSSLGATENGGGSGGWGADKDTSSGGGSGSNSSWGGTTGNGRGDDKGGGGSGGWGTDKGKGGGSDDGGGNGSGWGSGSNSGWGGGNAGSGTSKDVPKSGSSGWG